MQSARSTLSSVTSTAILHFSALYHQWHDFEKLLLKMECVFWFSLQILTETFLILFWLINLELSQQIFQKKIIENAEWELSLPKRADAMEVSVAFYNITNAHIYWINFYEIFNGLVFRNFPLSSTPPARNTTFSKWNGFHSVVRGSVGTYSVPRWRICHS